MALLMPRLPLQEIHAFIQHVPASAPASLAAKACRVAVAIVIIVVEHDDEKV